MERGVGSSVAAGFGERGDVDVVGGGLAVRGGVGLRRAMGNTALSLLQTSLKPMAFKKS